MMKVDMGGAAATLGTAIAALKPDVEVHFVSAVTENMISGRAVHPGDILTASTARRLKLITPTPGSVNPGRRGVYRKAGRGCDH